MIEHDIAIGSDITDQKKKKIYKKEEDIYILLMVGFGWAVDDYGYGEITFNAFIFTFYASSVIESIIFIHSLFLQLFAFMQFKAANNVSMHLHTI